MYIWTCNKLVSANHVSTSSNSGHVSSVMLFAFLNLQYQSREQQTLAQFSPKTPKLKKVQGHFLLIYERNALTIAITRLIARNIFRWLAHVFCIVSQSNWRFTVLPSLSDGIPDNFLSKWVSLDFPWQRYQREGEEHDKFINAILTRCTAKYVCTS